MKSTARWIVMSLATAACSKTACVEPAPKSKQTTPVTAPAATARTLTLEQYDTLVYGEGPQATFAPTTATEHAVVDDLVQRMFEGCRAPEPPDPLAWQARAASAGFRIEVWTVEGQTFWALLEEQGKVRGAGAYIFRVGGEREQGPILLLEAPHNFFDLGTGELAAQMFFPSRQGPRPRALFTNTIHRYQLAPGDKKKRKHNPADVAHNPEHAFTVATMAFARAAREVRVIQLHGFGARTDDDDEGDPASIAMVVSAGDAAGSSAVSGGIAVALGRVFGDGVKRFPEDVQMLGATTNAQGRLLRDLRGARFVHIEMSSAIRKRLAAEPTLRERLAAVLFATNPEEP